MGNQHSGRKPKPRAQAEIEGERKDRLNDNEPMPDKTIAVVPRYELSALARVTWDRLAPDMIKMGVLTHADVDAFAAYCEAVALNQWAATMMQARGAVAGPEKVSSYLTVWMRSSEEIRKGAARFGLTPSDRRSIEVPKPPTDGGKDPSRYLTK